MKRRTLIFSLCVLFIFGLSAMFAQAGAPATLNVTVGGTQAGITCTRIGACEGGDGFNIADITDVGINTYRIWASAAESEPVDDDGVFGSPTIAQIKANPNIIPWSVWDTNMKSTAFRGHGVSFFSMLSQLKTAGIAPVISLVNVNNGNQPTWMQQLNPPNSDPDWNEWWEHVFATVYYLNVQNNLGVNDFQVHNEPDNAGQGWGGTIADYILFTQKTYDAIKYVYDTYLPGQTFKIYAAVTVGDNDWLLQSMIQNDNIIDVYDWHNYGGGSSADAVIVHGWMDQYNSDGIHEEFFCSEWGTYRESYDNWGNATGKWASMLMNNNLNNTGHVDGSAIFSMYSWGTMSGLINGGVKSAMFYVMRLLNRSLNGGKPQYPLTWTPGGDNIGVASKAGTTLYVTIKNGGRTSQTVNLNVSAHKMTGTVTFRRASSGYPDVVTGTGTLVNGQISYTLPNNSIMQVIIP